MFEVRREEFESLVAAAVDALPDEFRDRISNVDFVVEAQARAEDHVLTRAPAGATLLGVYRGVPLTHRLSGYHMTLPDRIVVFQQPIERVSRDADDLAKRIAAVVRHEVAHYFGISDERLREIDAY